MDMMGYLDRLPSYLTCLAGRLRLPLVLLLQLWW